ncbi:MAG: hypothetical protein ACOCQ4_01295 [bacterium]
MKKNNQNIGINTSLTIKVVTNQLKIEKNNKVLHTITGISVFPEHLKIEPTEIKNKLITKADSIDNELGIETKLHNGEYFVNIVDYNFGEISYAANFLTDRWSENIWQLLTILPEKKRFTATLKPPAIKKQLLKANPDLFNTNKDIDDFCHKYNLNIEQFVVPAYFYQLEFDLKGISARLSREIFFFRRKMFTELLITKLESKIKNNIEVNIPTQNLILYKDWKNQELDTIDEIHKYIKSPFIFESTEQFDYYFESIVSKPDRLLHQDLISECNYWINDFPTVKKRFERAVFLFKEGKDYRDSLDNLRLTLELLLKALLNNNKSLENQLSEISNYQKQHGIGKETRNMFQKVLDCYLKFQNDKVKHDDDLGNINEVEFIFSLTMIFIRILIKSNNKLAVTCAHKKLRG